MRFKKFNLLEKKTDEVQDHDTLGVAKVLR